MAVIYHLPNDTGWAGHGSGGGASFRFEVKQTYDQSTNKSTLVITMQVKLASSSFIRNYELQAGSASFAGTTVTFSGNTYSIVGVAGAWADVKTGGSTATWTKTLIHNNDGSLNVVFGLSGLNLYSTYNGTYYISNFGTKSATLSLQETPSQPPTIGTPTASVVDQTGNFPSTYIAGSSKVKVRATVTPNGNATISSVKLSYPGGTTVNMTVNNDAYEATTAEPITGNTTFTVTATNSNGQTSSKTVSVTGVVPYTAPSIIIDPNDTYRCDSGGTKEDGGTYYKVKATANYYSSLSGNSITTFNVKIGSGTATDLTSGVQSGAISGMSDPNARYTITLTVQDKVSSSVTRTYVLEGATRNVVIKRSSDGTYIGVGTTPSRSSGKSDIELQAGGELLIGAFSFTGIGSVVITTTNTNPQDELGGTWTEVSQSAIPGLHFWQRTA